MGQLWDIVETWRDGIEFPPSYRQIAARLGVSSTSFETWKNPVDIPKRRNLLAIADLTGVPYRYVVQAAIDDTRLFDEAAMRERYGMVQAQPAGDPPKPERTIRRTKGELRTVRKRAER